MAAASPVLPLGLLHMRPFLWWMKELRLHIYITFMHLADAFIQSDLQLHSGYTFFFFFRTCWESNPQPFAQLTQCSTTEPHRNTPWYTPWYQPLAYQGVAQLLSTPFTMADHDGSRWTYQWRAGARSLKSDRRAGNGQESSFPGIWTAWNSGLSSWLSCIFSPFSGSII